MSLPPATKDISVHPAPGSVVDPIDKAQKAADVDRKIRLYGVIEAFRNGRLPSNRQIDQTLRYVLDHSPVVLDDLSPEGKTLIQDTRDIINTARFMVQEKNADELFQNFIWHTRAVDSETLKPGNLNEALTVDSGKAKSDTDQAVRHLRSLLNLVLTNSEVRKLLVDFSTIGRDLLAKGASKAAEGLAPTEQQLRNVNQSAPADQFITEGGGVAGTKETPVLEAQVPGTDRTIRQHPKDSEPHLLDPDGTRRGLGELQSQGRQRLGELREGGAIKAGEVGHAAQRNAQELADEDSSEGVDQKKQGMRGRFRQMKDNVKEGLGDRIPQQHKDTFHEKIERGKHFVSEEYFPEERRDQFIFRGKKVIMECQKHDNYQDSVRWLLGYIEEYAKHGTTTAGSFGQAHVEGVSKDANFNLCMAELRTLLERFANGTSLDSVIDAINVLVDDARRDPALREWFCDVDVYIHKVLLEVGYVLEPDCNTQARRLRERGREFYDVKHRGHFDDLFSSIGDWFKAMGQDPVNQRFGEDWARLTRDLLFDSEGSLKFKANLWNDIRKVILPQLIKEIGYIPIPRIEYTDDSLDLVVENLTLQGRNLFPNIIAIDARNFVKFSPYDAIADDSHHQITLDLEQMQADMRDVAFYFRKKTGIPKMTDSGLADVTLGGEGLSATIHLVSTRHDPSSVFTVKHIHVKVGSLKFAIRDSKHDFLYKTIRPIATGLIKRQIQKAIGDALRTGLEYVDGQLVGVRERVGEGKFLKTLSTNKEEASASVKTGSSGKASHAHSPTHGQSRSHFKIVSDKRNSILSGTGHPAGWVNRTEEKRELAEGGARGEKEEWKSDAFNIV